MEKRKAGRPKGSKDKKPRKLWRRRRSPYSSGPPPLKKPKKNPRLVETPKHFRAPRPPGAPRKDGMPPIRRKALKEDELPEVQRMTRFIGRIRHLAGRGMSPPHIAVLMGIPIEEVSPKGTYYDDVEIGRAEAVLAVAENHYNRVLAGKSTHEVMFFLKSIGGWAETADGRKKSRGELTEGEEVSGIDVSFDDDEDDEAI